jgi:hypothetical protein
VRCRNWDRATVSLFLTCEDEAQALVRASPALDQGGRDQGGRAVRACLALVELKRRFAEGAR